MTDASRDYSDTIPTIETPPAPMTIPLSEVVDRIVAEVHDRMTLPTGTAMIYGSLAAAQAEFEPIRKSKTATVRGETKRGTEYEYTYSYADIADVLSEVRPKLARHGVAVFTTTEYLILEGKIRHELTARLVAADGSSIESKWLLRDRTDPQDVGSELTYFRRYLISGLCGVATEDDDDGQRAGRSRPEAREQRARRGRPESDDNGAEGTPSDKEGRAAFREDLGRLLADADQQTKDQYRDWLRMNGYPATTSAAWTVEQMAEALEEARRIRSTEPWEDDDDETAVGTHGDGMDDLEDPDSYEHTDESTVTVPAWYEMTDAQIMAAVKEWDTAARHSFLKAEGLGVSGNVNQQRERAIKRWIEMRDEHTSTDDDDVTDGDDTGRPGEEYHDS